MTDDSSSEESICLCLVDKIDFIKKVSRKSDADLHTLFFETVLEFMQNDMLSSSKVFYERNDSIGELKAIFKLMSTELEKQLYVVMIYKKNENEGTPPSFVIEVKNDVVN